MQSSFTPLLFPIAHIFFSLPSLVLASFFNAAGFHLFKLFLLLAWSRPQAKHRLYRPPASLP